MLSAALIELFDRPDEILAELNGLGIPEVKYIAEKTVKMGVTGTSMRVMVNGEEEGTGEHHHEHLHDHHHDHGHGASSPEERMALLKYMLSHNAHHAEELHELAHTGNSEASELIHEAVDLIGQSNEKLERAIKLLEEDK